MRIMILNHQSKREGSPEYEARVVALFQSYASPGITVEMHYQAIIPLGRRLVPYVVSPPELEAELKVPVINTKLIGIRHAETLVIGKTTHSLQSYPWSAGLTPDQISRRTVE